jgi:regulator of RNase E activity RraA
VTSFPDPPYAAEVAFLDSLRPGDVVVATTGGSPSAFWGELFSTAAAARGARGAVVDGYVRDQVKIEATGFPVFATGARPADSHGRLSIVAQDVLLDLGGVTVRSGDLVVADCDGVVVVPREVCHEVIGKALEKAALENQARDLLREGALLADVWERFRVL